MGYYIVPTQNTIDSKTDLEWSETMMPQVIDILEKQIGKQIEKASTNEDLNQATDLISGDGKRICVRIRRDKRPERDLTIRVEKGSSKTELHKLKKGYGDIYFYAWSDNDNLNEWILVDLHGMRKSGILDTERRWYVNKDGYTCFIAFSATELRNHRLLISEQLA